MSSENQIPETTMDELERAYAQAADLTEAFSDAIKEQAAKYSLDATVLRRVIRARARDKMDDLRDNARMTLDLL